MNEPASQPPRSPADAVFHPVRLRIIRALGGRHMTPREIAAELPDIPPASLYRHLNALAALGVATVVSERRVRGATERTYTIPDERGVLSATDVRDLDAGEHLRLFAIFLAGVLADFGRYLDHSSPDIAADGVGYRQVDLYLSDAELRAMLDELNATLAHWGAQRPEPGRRRRLFTRIVMPAAGPANREDGDTDELDR